ncbi:MAG: anti-sigma factor domain-containing protein [Pseudonocardiaceae bacterium]
MNDQKSKSGCALGELAVGWALHALEPAEESVVAVHLLDCAECARIVAETEQVGATLGLSIPEMTPSPELEQRILAVTNVGEAAPVIPLVQPTQRTTKVVRPISRVLAAAVAVVLAAASVALGIRVVQVGGERDQAERQAIALSEAIQQAADPASVRVPLVNEDGRAMGMVLAGRDKVAIVPTGLPGNRVEDQIYVLWGLDDGTPRALTGFDVAPDAPVLHAVPSVRGAGKFTGYAVSLEPGRRTPAAPTTVLATGRVES